jgi:hypothetical protein
MRVLRYSESPRVADKISLPDDRLLSLPPTQLYCQLYENRNLSYLSKLPNMLQQFKQDQTRTENDLRQ